MLKQIINFYLWVKRIFKKQMSAGELYTELSILRNQVFDNVTAYIKSKEKEGYLKFISQDNENGVIEFKVGQFRFLFKAELYVFKRHVLYRTFQRNIKLDLYPTIRYKNTHVEDLDILSHFSRAHEFKTPKKSKGIFPNSRSLVTVSRINLEDFGQMYLEQIDNWLLENEN